MNANKAQNNPKEAMTAFFGKNIEKCTPFGNGHINNTFVVDDGKKYILQHINDTVFLHPDQMMENILGVTEHIRKKAIYDGEDASRTTLNVVYTSDGKSCFKDSYGLWWRCYDFIEKSVAYDSINCAEDFYRCAKAFGKFQQRLADYPAKTLHETIKNFHNTPLRFEKLSAAIKNDVVKRADKVKDEIGFAMERKEFASMLEDAHKKGKLPLRVTHNDTKLNNILFDEETGLPICVIDLDTVMPGYSVNDFGDAIRFGANTASEDETDISKISLDLNLFEAFAKGFLEGCDGRLTDNEIELLPIGAMMMTFECGMRFLTDYLEGDVYFKIHRKDHNLDRCRNQFALLLDMERKLPKMQEIIEKLK